MPHLKAYLDVVHLHTMSNHCYRQAIKQKAMHKGQQLNKIDFVYDVLSHITNQKVNKTRLPRCILQMLWYEKMYLYRIYLLCILLALLAFPILSFWDWQKRSQQCSFRCTYTWDGVTCLKRPKTCSQPQGDGETEQLMAKVPKPQPFNCTVSVRHQAKDSRRVPSNLGSIWSPHIITN